MGYEVHVTRASDWLDSDSHPITEVEWRACVEGDAELELTGAFEADVPGGEVLRYESPLLAVWSGHPSVGLVPFDFRESRVVVKSPDEAIMRKLGAVAAALSAHLIGDDGEHYDGAGELVAEEPVAEEPAALRERKRSWWRRVFG